MVSTGRPNPFVRPAPGFFPGGQRRRLLDQLRHLSQWSRRALLVLGPAGAGKTMLANQLAEEVSASSTLAQLDGRNLNTELDVLIVLTEALGIDVPESFSALLLMPLVVNALEEQQDAETPLSLLVDDADELDSDALELLLKLCAEHRFRLLLFGTPELPDQLRGAAKALELAPYETLLSPFTPADSRAFLEWRFEQAGVKDGIPFSEDQLADLYRRSEGTPGELNRLAGQLLERIQDGDKALPALRFPATHLYLIAGLAAVLALSFLLLDRVNLTEEVVTEALPLDDYSDDSAPPVPVVPALQVTGQAGTEVDDPVDRAPTVKTVSEPVQSEPLADGIAARQPIARPEAPPRSPVVQRPDPEPVVATKPKPEPKPKPDPKPDPKPEPKPEPEPKPKVPERVEPTPAKPEAVASEPTTQPAPAQPDPAEPTRDAVAAPVATAASEPTPEPVVPPARTGSPLRQPMTMAALTDSILKEVPGLKDGAWLLAQDPSYYTMQLVTLSSRDGLLRYLKKQSRPANFAVYAREVGGSLLYVVTYGRYADRAAAESAGGQLPSTIGKIKPWIRPFAEVHGALTGG